MLFMARNQNKFVRTAGREISEAIQAEEKEYYENRFVLGLAVMLAALALLTAASHIAI
jgi:hypothetical protein